MSQSQKRQTASKHPSELSPEKLDQRIRNVLLFQLGRAAKTEHQLRQLLLKREFPEAAFEPILQRFVEAQIIDDRAYAHSYVNSRMAAGGRSKAALRRELRQRGVAAELIDEALAFVDQDLELEQAIELARGRWRRMSSLDDITRRRRVFGFLQRRGYSGSVVQAAIRACDSGSVKSQSDVDTDL